MVKLFSYALTGGTAAIVDAGSFVALLHAGLPAISAGTVSFCIAAVINYRLTARHVFSRDASLRGFLLFLLGALGGMLVNVGVTTFAITGGGCPADRQDSRDRGRLLRQFRDQLAHCLRALRAAPDEDQELGTGTRGRDGVAWAVAAWLALPRQSVLGSYAGAG